MSQYRLTEEADNDLIEIWLHISQDNLESADKFLETLVEKFALLAGQPKIGRARPELAPRLRSFPAGRYIIFYRLIPDGVEIARILHSRRDIESVFEN
jgi:toxin ParE1/3/4